MHGLPVEAYDLAKLYLAGKVAIDKVFESASLLPSNVAACRAARRAYREPATQPVVTVYSDGSSVEFYGWGKEEVKRAMVALSDLKSGSFADAAVSHHSGAGPSSRAAVTHAP